MTNRLFYLFLFTLFACSGNKDSDIAKIKLKEFEGQTIDLNQYQGKAVFINFGQPGASLAFRRCQR